MRALIASVRRWLFGEPKPRPMTIKEIMAEFEAESKAEMDAVRADIHRQLDELQEIADRELRKRQESN